MAAPSRIQPLAPQAWHWLAEEAHRRAEVQGRAASEVEEEMSALLASGWPLQYVLGHWSFHGIELLVDARALIPRPETEQLVELVLGRLGGRVRVLELGTGTGAIALALRAARPELEVVATDVSREALALARENASVLGLGEGLVLREGSWYDVVPPGEHFDVVVANPPYVAEEEHAVLDPWVREFEPRGALVAGPTGLECLAELISGLELVLAPGGFAAFEIGERQGEALSRMASRAGLIAEVHRDLAGRDRFLVLEMRQ
jgi:release factor glutamine methyltransferase